MNPRAWRAALLLITSGYLTGAVAMEDPINDMLKAWNYQDPAASEATFRTLLEDTEPAAELYPATLSQIARTYSLRRQFDESHAHLDEAEQHLASDMPRACTLVHLERGRAFNSNGQIEDALPQFRAAFQVADAAALDDLATDAAHMLGIAESGQRAERWNLIAMAIAETSDDPNARRWLGPLYNNLGWTYFDNGETEKALALFEKGVDYRKSANQEREWQIARWTVARAWRELGRLDEALEAQTTLLDEVSREGFQLGYINEELGELYLLKDDPKHVTHFATAWQILSADDWLVANEADRLNRLKQLGGLHD